MKTNPLRQLGELGQSIWLDYIRRDLIRGGGLKRLIDEDGLRGMTSNPAIFEQAILESHEYDAEISSRALHGDLPPSIYEGLTQADVQGAADAFRPLYDASKGGDGYVSLEVNPHLAHDLQGTLGEARRLWKALGRPNVLIKVPATDEGVAAIRQLIGEGISVNVTLLFGLPRYRQVVEAYLSGLEALASAGKPMQGVASVASFFVSRIDVLIDAQLDKIAGQGGERADAAKRLRGQAAIASARLAYQIYKEAFGSPRFKALAAKNARTQRLLWASTGTKDPAYSDIKYVEALIGPETVNTLPVKTLDAYRDHGMPKSRIEEGLEESGKVLESLQGLGITIDAVTRQLKDEGVVKFDEPFDKLMNSLAARSSKTSPAQAPSKGAGMGHS